MTYPYQPDPFADRSQAKNIYDQAAQLAERARRDLAAAQAIKGLALWCETGGHAFSQRDRGRQEWQVRVFDIDAGEEVTETRVCCSRCAKTGSITDKAKHLPAELVAQAPELERRPPARPVADPEYTAYLEWQAQQPIGAKVGLADYFRAMGVAAEPNTGVG